MLLSGRIPGPHKSLTRIESLHKGGTSYFSLRHKHLLYQPKYTLRPGLSARWTSRLVVFGQTGPSSSDSTIKSLESILGSLDGQGEDGNDPGDDDMPRSWRKAPEAAARRVRPLYVYVIYYCFIVVYLADAWLQATDGDLAASILVDGLVNDHLAVASGQIPRLATAGFVCDGPLELFLQLATLLTVGAEAEALLGYSLFWAVYWLANLGGGLADSAFSELPVTYGPANAAAGMVGALAAYYVRNLGLEERIEAARRAVRRRKRQILEGIGSSSMDGDLGPEPGGRESLEEAETEVEVLPLVSFTVTTRISPAAKGLLNLGVALVMAGQGLLDFGDASSSASWIGLMAAFWTGLLLTFGAGPQYEVQYKLPESPPDIDTRRPSSSSSSSSNRGSMAGEAGGGGCHHSGSGEGDGGGGSSSRRPSGNAEAPQSSSSSSSSSTALKAVGEASRREVAVAVRREEAGGSRIVGGPDGADYDGLTVVDVCPPSRRQSVLGGYVAGLAAVIFGWLAWMGTGI